MRSQGIVLVVALLFLFAVALLGISIFETSILQTKMQQHFHSKVASFQQAETALLTAENAITYDQVKGEDSAANFHYSFILVPNQCKLPQHCYLIEAMGMSGAARTVLQSIYLIESQKKYRLSWREME